MSTVPPSSQPLADRLAALAAFLPAFTAPGASFGRWFPEEGAPSAGGTFVVPWFELSPMGAAFLDACYTHRWVVPVDWVEWRKTPRARALYDDPAALAEATPEELALLLTSLVRGDRFCEGTLAGAYDEGVLLRVVQRAAALAAEHPVQA